MSRCREPSGTAEERVELQRIREARTRVELVPPGRGPDDDSGTGADLEPLPLSARLTPILLITALILGLTTIFSLITRLLRE